MGYWAVRQLTLPRRGDPGRDPFFLRGGLTPIRFGWGPIPMRHFPNPKGVGPVGQAFLYVIPLSLTSHLRLAT